MSARLGNSRRPAGGPGGPKGRSEAVVRPPGLTTDHDDQETRSVPAEPPALPELLGFPGLVGGSDRTHTSTSTRMPRAGLCSTRSTRTATYPRSAVLPSASRTGVEGPDVVEPEPGDPAGVAVIV